MDMNWWSDNRLRLIQNNLRETDADLDVDLLIRELREFNTNVLMMNAGGIVAFYPSTLEYQYISSSLIKDLLGETITKAHEAGMRFIARFDFSKAHESIFAKRPEWFYRTKAGDAVNYHGIVHTCLNSYYQQEYSLIMIDEVLSKYPVDGVFFNMFGYKTQDYSGKEYGLCYCDNCSGRFRAMFDLALPEQVSDEDPNFGAYKLFQEITTRDMLDRIHDFGPPERAYGHQLTQWAGLGIVEHEDGGGKALYYPWSIGELYYKHGYEDHKYVLTDPLVTLLPQTRVTTNAPPSVELFLHQLPDGSTMLQLINLSGFNGVTYHKPLHISNIHVSIPGLKPPKGAKLLYAGKPIDLDIDESGDVSFTLEVLEQYEAIVLNTGTL